MDDHRAPSDIAAEADVLEQQHPVDTDESVVEPDAAPLASEHEAAEADLVEQVQPVPGEDDYPHGELDAE